MVRASRTPHSASIVDGAQPLVDAGIGAEVVRAEATYPGSIVIKAKEFEGVTGSPTLTNTASNGSTYVTHQQQSGTADSSVATVVSEFPAGVAAVRINARLFVISSGATASSRGVYKMILSQPADGQAAGTPQILYPRVMADVPNVATGLFTATLDTFVEIDPTRDLFIRVFRHTSAGGDPQAGAWTSALGLVRVELVPVSPPADPITISAPAGYQAWPVIKQSGSNLVCLYAEGTIHASPDAARVVKRRISTDNGATWGAEATVIDTGSFIDDQVWGKGTDSSGRMLVWVRNITTGNVWTHHLWRSADDGVTWSSVSSPTLSPAPIEVTDIIDVPGVGLMSFWHAGAESGESGRSYGKLVSTDNGLTWTQTTIETVADDNNWPVEMSAAYLGSNRIIVIGRNQRVDDSSERVLFQITSTNSGSTWSRQLSNISDVFKSTPNLIYDDATDLLHLYYYERLKGRLRRRVVDPDTVFTNPKAWPPSDVVAVGSKVENDAGQVNACVGADGKHKVAYYSGSAPDLGIYLADVTPRTTPTS